MTQGDRFVLFETRGAIALITLNRPESRNAQNSGLLYELDDAFARFAADDDLVVAVLAGAGDHFSSGHDLGTAEADFEVTFDRRSLWWDHVPHGLQNPEGLFAREQEVYLELCRRWRDQPKPTIAMVQGACIAGGLMLAWACDLIVAADDAFFSDPLVPMGMPGNEFFRHPFEMGSRQAKEFLFLAERFDAERALQLGMVNRVVPRPKLERETFALAERIAEMPRFALALAKQAVNQADDAAGQRVAMDAAHALHHVAHAHNIITSGDLVSHRPRGSKSASP